jgi:hypothetical protein
MARACAQRPEAGIMEAEIFEPDPGGTSRAICDRRAMHQRQR